jgi:hypothetical protein
LQTYHNYTCHVGTYQFAKGTFSYKFLTFEHTDFNVASFHLHVCTHLLEIIIRYEGEYVFHAHAISEGGEKNTAFFLKVCQHTKFQDPVLTASSVVHIFDICTTAMFVLLKVKN